MRNITLNVFVKISTELSPEQERSGRFAITEFHCRTRMKLVRRQKDKDHLCPSVFASILVHFGQKRLLATTNVDVFCSSLGHRSHIASTSDKYIEPNDRNQRVRQFVTVRLHLNKFFPWWKLGWRIFTADMVHAMTQLSFMKKHAT